LLPTDAGADTVAPGAGILVPPDAPEAFAKALEQVLGDAVLRGRMAAASRQAGAALPGWPDTARLAGEVLDRVPLPGTRV
jgi:glycosyltransferase involved in cell wall biosynthesis